VEEIIPKDDTDSHMSIGLWLDFVSLRGAGGQLFTLNKTGRLVKRLLKLISPTLYSALIVAVAKKQ
jgi:hypothetical protein